jgi:hypothetical protein
VNAVRLQALHRRKIVFSIDINKYWYSQPGSVAQIYLTSLVCCYIFHAIDVPTK